ncbi:hypothetical protein BH23ACT1_BH23ACT1_00320 [soil metagenome]
MAAVALAPASPEAALAAVSDAILGLAGERSVEAVLQRLVGAARVLVGARYAALGTPDAEGDGFSAFLTAGMTDELIDAIGPLPRTHGLLGTLLVDPTPLRSADVAADPRFTWWPEAHPRMGSFLGVPILFKGDIIGALYLADKVGAALFDEADERLVSLLAAHAAVAIEQARLVEASRELSIVEERSRLARELHDATVQTLFSLSLTAEAAVSLLTSDPEAAAVEVRRIQELAQGVVAELRSLVFELRPPALDEEGLATLAKLLEVLGRVHGLSVELVGSSQARLEPQIETGLLRIVQEALNNVVRHASAGRVRVAVEIGERAVTTTVADDGIGFDPQARAILSRRLGLTSMRERAQALGGTTVISSQPGAGTTVSVTVPRA